jgi:glycolate oxidase FAD binding subunit
LIQGLKSRTGDAARADFFLSTLSLNRILEHDLENFTVTAESGIEIVELQKKLESKNQKALLLGGGTLGGLVAANPLQNPRIRDQVLGMTVILAGGAAVQFGGKVMKNVAGYDASKLFLGSRGTLGLVYAVTLKTYPLNYPSKVIRSDTMPAFSGSSGSRVRDGVNRKIKTAFDPEKVFPSLSEL